jgi:N-acetyl-anhydromuramyl-L-alanine amidase AmpD
MELSGMAEPADFQFDLPMAGRPAPFQLFEQPYPGVREYWEAATSRRIFDPMLGVTAIVIHSSSGTDSEGVMAVMKARRASWHWLVPREDEAQHGHFVWACAPEARAARHVRNSCSHPDVEAGRARVNHFSLALQIISRESAGFSDWQIFAASEIIRFCWAKYPNLRQVVSHARLDPERRRDPGADFPWDMLRDKVVGAPPGEIAPLVARATPMMLLPRTRFAAVCGG